MTKSSLKPKRWHLYPWNAVEGFLGLPKRKIQLPAFEPCLLHLAYLAEGAEKIRNVPKGQSLTCYSMPLPLANRMNITTNTMTYIRLKH